MCDFNLCLLHSIYNYSFSFTSHNFIRPKTVDCLSKAYIFKLFYQRILSYIFILNPGIGLSICLHKINCCSGWLVGKTVYSKCLIETVRMNHVDMVPCCAHTLDAIPARLVSCQTKGTSRAMFSRHTQ